MFLKSYWEEYFKYFSVCILVGTWYVQQQNVTCLVVQMDIKVNFNYTTTGMSKFRQQNFPLNYASRCKNQVFFLIRQHNYLWLIDNENEFISLDNQTKAVTYEIPANETLRDDNGSKCGDLEDTLKVSWNINNTFEMTFKLNGTKYDLSSFIIALNTSSLYNDSNGEWSRVITLKWIHYKFSFSHHLQLIKQWFSHILTISHMTSHQTSPITVIVKESWTLPMAFLWFQRFSLKHLERTTPKNSQRPKIVIQTLPQTSCLLLLEFHWLLWLLLSWLLTSLDADDSKLVDTWTSCKQDVEQRSSPDKLTEKFNLISVTRKFQKKISSGLKNVKNLMMIITKWYIEGYLV